MTRIQLHIESLKWFSLQNDYPVFGACYAVE